MLREIMTLQSKKNSSVAAIQSSASGNLFPEVFYYSITAESNRQKDPGRIPGLF
jgi:hypothetical protein